MMIAHISHSSIRFFATKITCLNCHVMVKEYDLREVADRWRVSRPHSTQHSLININIYVMCLFRFVIKEKLLFASGLSVRCNAMAVDRHKGIKNSKQKLKVSFVRPWGLKFTSNLRSRRPCVCSHAANVIHCISPITCTSVCVKDNENENLMTK